MKARSNRDQLFLASKVGFGYPGVEKCLKPDVIITECEKSLKRLGVETIDLYYAHVDDRETALDETLLAFDKLVKDGKVRYIGASNYAAWRLEQSLWFSEISKLASFVAVQQRYTYARPNYNANFGAQLVANQELIDCCQANNLTLLAYSVLLGGAYVREGEFDAGYRGPDSDARLVVLKEVAQETNATVNQVVLAWMLHSDPPVLPLTAASTKERLQENLGSLNVSLSAEQMQRLNAAGV